MTKFGAAVWPWHATGASGAWFLLRAGQSGSGAAALGGTAVCAVFITIARKV
jgi:hypothetical protein